VTSPPTDPADHPPPPAAPEPAAEDEAALLLEFLQANDATCPACGYNLRALTAPRCPECGRPVRLNVVPQTPHERAWVVMIATTSAAAGTGLLFTLINLPGRFNDFPASWARAYFYAAIPLAVVIVAARRPITRLRPRWQWSIAAALALLSLVALVAASAML
jgi:hypothetical protein